MSYAAPPPPPEDPGEQPPAAAGGAAATPPPPPPPPPGFASPAAPAGATGEYAVWAMRAQSALIDWFGPFLVAGLVFAVSDLLGWLLYLAAFGWALYNAYIQGTTGQSTGKKMNGTKVVGLATGQPIGAGMSIARYFLHIVDSLACYIGYLWPLWDEKRQTFSDKIVSSVVVRV